MSTPSFPRPDSPIVFIASPSDVWEERESAARVTAKVAKGLAPHLKPYWWEQKKTWDASRSWQEQIYRPSDPNCKISILIFGERIGSPLSGFTDWNRLPAEFIDFVRTHNFPIDLDGTDPTKIPLTGSVFELLDAYCGAKLHENKVLVFLKGDSSIFDKGREVRNFGAKAYWKFLNSAEKLDKKKSDEYWEQVALVRRFYDEIIFSPEFSYQPEPFLNVEQFEMQLELALRSALGQDEYITEEQAFKGLSSFEISDRNAFFGRTKDIEDAIQALGSADRHTSKRPFMVLYGRSGSGKSSIAKAGIAGRLTGHASFVATEHRFAAVALTPDDLRPKLKAGSDANPLFVLGKEIAAAADLPNLASELDIYMEKIDCKSFARSLERHLRGKATPSKKFRLLIVLDQFERALAGEIDHFTKNWGPLIEALDILTRTKCVWVIVCIPHTPPDPNRPHDQQAMSWLTKWNSMPVVQVAERDGATILRKELSSQHLDYREIVTKPFERLKIEIEEAAVEKILDQIRDISANETSILPLVAMMLQDIYLRWTRAEEKSISKTRKAAPPAIPDETTSQGEFDQRLIDIGRRIREVRRISLKTLGDEFAAASSIERLGMMTQSIAGLGEGEGFETALSHLLRFFVQFDVSKYNFERLYATPGENKRFPIALASHDIQRWKLATIERRVLDALLQVRLAVPVSARKVALAHELILEHWPPAKAWYEREQKYLKIRQVVQSQFVRSQERVSEGKPSLYLDKTDALEAERLLVDWGTEEYIDDLVFKEQMDFILDSLKSIFLVTNDAQFGAERLFAAIQMRNRELALFYLNNKENPRGQSRLDVNAQFEVFRKPLYLVAAEYHTNDKRPLASIALRLLRSGAIISPDTGNFNIVHRLAANGNYSHLKALVRYVDRGVVAGMTPSRFQSLTSQKTKPKGWTPLHLAAQGGSAKIIQFLIKRGADVKWRTKDREELPIHVAARWGKTEAVLELLEVHTSYQLDARTKPPPKGTYSLTPLFSAIQRNKCETAQAIAKQLVATGVDLCKHSVIHHNFKEINALHFAIMNEHTDIVRMLVSKSDTGEAIFAHVPPMAHQWSPLHLAAHYDRPPHIPILAAAFPDSISAKDAHGETPLAVACHHAGSETIVALLTAGSDLRFKTPNGTALTLVVRRESAKILREILQFPNAVEALSVADSEGLYPIDYAVMSGRADIVEIILKEAAYDVTKKNGRGLTSLHVAALSGDMDCLRVLLAYANVDLPGNMARTALHLICGASRRNRNSAELGNRLAIATCLLSNGASPAARDKWQTTPLHYAAKEGGIAMVDLLLEHMPFEDWAAQTNRGQTALHSAAMGGNAEMVRVLLSKGFRADHKDGAGATPLDIAVRAGHREAALVLQQWPSGPESSDTGAIAAGRPPSDARRTSWIKRILGMPHDAR